MFWVGLTGGIASGKSTVAKIIASLGITVIDADRLAHEAMAINSDGAQAVRAAFGTDVFASDGTVDRVKLGALVFGDKSGRDRLKLEAILHPEVRKVASRERSRLAAEGAAMAVYEVPLLFEKNLEANFDFIVTVAVSPKTQLERLMKRSDFTKEAAQERIAAQLPQDLKIRAANFVIWNDGDEKNLRIQTGKVVKEILRREQRR